MTNLQKIAVALESATWREIQEFSAAMREAAAYSSERSAAEKILDWADSVAVKPVGEADQ